MKRHEHSGSTRKSLENPREVLLAAGLTRGQTVLDVGTGSGYLSLAASEIVGQSGKVYALDSFPDSITALKAVITEKAIGNIEPVAADAVETIPVPARSVDVCLMSNVLHGFAANDEARSVMAHVAVALKGTGEIVIIDFKKTETPFGPPLSIRLSPGEVENLMHGFGFGAVKQFDAGPYHYALVFKRKEQRTDAS